MVRGLASVSFVLLGTCLPCEVRSGSADAQATNGSCLLQRDAVLGQALRRRRRRVGADIKNAHDGHLENARNPNSSVVELDSASAGSEISGSLKPGPGSTKLHAYTKIVADIYEEWKEFIKHGPGIKSLEEALHSHHLVSIVLKDLPKVDDSEYYTLALKTSLYLDTLIKDSRVFMHTYKASGKLGRWWNSKYFSRVAENIRQQAEHMVVDLHLLQAYGLQKLVAAQAAQQKQDTRTASQAIQATLHNELKKNREKSSSDMRRAVQSVVHREIAERSETLAARINETVGSIVQRGMGGNLTHMLKALLHGEIDRSSMEKMAAQVANVEDLARSDFAVGVVTSAIILLMLLWLTCKYVRAPSR